ncbi:MAG: relaxase/mobilization nuclease domain-containing protein [Devosia sp.]
MILKGNQRGGALRLAQHLLNREENDHVTVHDLRGFASGSLTGALQEALAISKATQCRQFLFSVSLNPPEMASVKISNFEEAAARIERKLGLEGQPRALVIHEKQGRRHAHAVWSRIDPETMTAINLPYYKLKLLDVSKQLFLDHGWRLPDGMRDPSERDPATFSREEWQQARRVGQDAKALKRMFAECWAASDSASGLGQALAERGLLLAKGDRRGAVALDYRGEVYALARWAGVKTKEVKARLGDKPDLPDLPQAREMMAARMTSVIHRHIQGVETSLKRSSATLALKTAQLKERHLADRDALKETHARRWVQETQDRASRFRPGLGGLWDRFTGKHKQIQRRNEEEAYRAITRDDIEREELVAAQLGERRDLQTDVTAMRQRHHEELSQLRSDVATYAGWSGREIDRKNDLDPPLISEKHIKPTGRDPEDDRAPSH